MNNCFEYNVYYIGQQCTYYTYFIIYIKGKFVWQYVQQNIVNAQNVDVSQ